jgi:ribonuclease D
VADYKIISTSSDLEQLANDLLKEDVVAVDTEADSFYHYYDKTCLVQVATRKDSWLIDPLELGGPANLAPLGPVFASPDVRVLFHAAEYDIFVLKRDCDFTFDNLFDTMVSAQLLGYPAIGLAALVEHHFGVNLPKDEQRSDWSRRPLSDKQLSYALSDVLYLVKLSEKLEKELRKAGRLEWAQSDFAALCQRRWPDREFDRLGYLRIKGARLLDPVSLAVLRELFLMRDKRAREIDRPPFKVLGNRTLLEIAGTHPETMDGLSKMKGVTDLIIRRMGNDLSKAVNKGLRKPHGPIPKLEGNGRKRMDRRTERRLAVLKKWRTPRSEELKLDPGVLCPNAALEAIAIRDPKTASDLEGLPELKSWFVRSFAPEIVEVLEAGALAEEMEKEHDEKPAPSRRRRGRDSKSSSS